VSLLFSGSFDNNVLHLTVGQAVRAEVIVSFGNAANSGTTATNVDINGNGVIDADETRVRSVPARITGKVPAKTPANATPSLSDSASNIATTGTVTYSNASFNLGATTGTATVSYNGGTSGGTITNCATLTGTGSTTTVGGFTFPDVIGVDLQACDTETIGAAACTPGTPGCGWKDGDLTTYGQGDWGDDPSTNPAASLLYGQYDTVYASSGGVLDVGISSSGGFSLLFSDKLGPIDYLPATGPSGPLTSDLLDPTSSSAGEFGGDVVALRINVDFSDAAVLPATVSTRFGDLTLCGIGTPTGIDGLTVRQYLDIVQTLLGGGSNGFQIADLDPLTQDLNFAFSQGAATVFAQDHLFQGPCP
jgi:hypothetical protein